MKRRPLAVIPVLVLCACLGCMDMGMNTRTYSPSPREYLVALYVIPLWICLILVCLRSSSRFSPRRHAANNAGEQAQSEEEGPSGLSSSSLQKILKFSFHSKSAEAAKDKYHITECSVCMDPFDEGDIIRELPVCGHRFHMECVDEWLALHPNCPICRMDTRQALDGGTGESTQVGDGPGSLEMSTVLSIQGSGGAMPSAPALPGNNGNNTHPEGSTSADVNMSGQPGLGQAGDGSFERESAVNGAFHGSQDETTRSHSLNISHLGRQGEGESNNAQRASVASYLSTWVSATAWLARARLARIRHGSRDEVLDALPTSRRNRARTFLRRQSLVQRQVEPAAMTNSATS